MILCLSVYLSVSMIKILLLELHEKYQKMGLGPTLVPLNFESHLDHHLDTNKKNSYFPICLLLSTLADICIPRVLLCNVCVLLCNIASWHSS